MASAFPIADDGRNVISSEKIRQASFDSRRGAENRRVVVLSLGPPPMVVRLFSIQILSKLGELVLDASNGRPKVIPANVFKKSGDLRGFSALR